MRPHKSWRMVMFMPMAMTTDAILFRFISTAEKTGFIGTVAV